MRSIIGIAALIATVAAQAGPEYQRRWECGLSGCRVVCIGQRGKVLIDRRARVVSMSMLRSGVTLFELEERGNDRRHVLVGPDSYLCEVHDT